MLVAIPACDHARGARDPFARRVDPDAFRTLPLPKLGPFGAPPASAPRRIVSAIPSATEFLFTIGFGDRVVGRSDWCDWPPEVEKIPALGNQQTFGVERVADLLPDLVVFWKHLPDKAQRLTDLFRLRIVTPGTEDQKDALDGMAAIATACGVPERGERVVAHVRDTLARVRAACATRPRLRLLMVLDRGQAFYVPGRESFLQDLFDTCNLENVAAGLDAGRWPAVSIEQVLDWNPDVILDLSLGASSTPAQVDAAYAFWAPHTTLAAVRSGRVIVVHSGVLVRPGPRLGAVAETLAEIVHGDR